jgi:hypothetical protein
VVCYNLLLAQEGNDSYLYQVPFVAFFFTLDISNISYSGGRGKRFEVRKEKINEALSQKQKKD